MCEEESEDTEAVAKLFEINDSIHRTIERYKLIKKGDVEAANQIRQGTLGRSGAGVSKGPDNTLNLIDFGDPEPAPAAAASSAGGPAQPAPKGNALEDDLLGLSLGGSNYGQSGSISLGGSNGSGRFRKRVSSSTLIALSTWSLWRASTQITSPTAGCRTIYQRSIQVSSYFKQPIASSVTSTVRNICTIAAASITINTRPVCCSDLTSTTTGIPYELPTVNQTADNGIWSSRPSG
jgi:hypothetical protein